MQIAPIASDPGDPAEGPTFSISVGTEDAMAWASVTLNAHAVTATLEGALGGNASSNMPAALAGPELSPAQRALLTRVVVSLALDLSAAIREEVGLLMTILPGDAPPPSGQTSDALQLACHIEGLQVPASIILSTSAEALEVAAREHGQGGTRHKSIPVSQKRCAKSHSRSSPSWAHFGRASARALVSGGRCPPLEHRDR